MRYMVLSIMYITTPGGPKMEIAGITNGLLKGPSRSYTNWTSVLRDPVYNYKNPGEYL